MTALVAEMEIAAITTETLRAELARGLTLTADTLTRLGMVWMELERRGEDLSSLRNGLGRTLPLIASGRLAAEAVVAFAGRPMLLRALEGVDLDRQRRFARGETVEVIDPADATATAMPLTSLPMAAVRLVFSGGEVRTPQAQRLALRKNRKTEPQSDDRQYKPRFDAASGKVQIGNMRFKLADLLHEIGGTELPAIVHKEEYVTLKVRLLPSEQKKLAEQVQIAEIPDWELARKALRAFGLI